MTEQAPAPPIQKLLTLVMKSFLMAVLFLVGAAGLLHTAPTASAQPPPFGPDTCKQGYVWREAILSDHVCVTPDTRSQTSFDNGQAASRRNPTGPFGSDTCIQGYVWREAFPNDHVCVTPDTRSQAAFDNSQAASRRAG
jgi:hypothetical protein